MARIERAANNMIVQFGDKWFMVLWYTGLVRWMIRRKKSIEKAAESAFTYETDVTNLNRAIQPRWTGLP